MKFFKKFKKDTSKDPNKFWNNLSEIVALDRTPLQKMPKNDLANLIAGAQANYRNGLSADRAGEKSIARQFYEKAFEALPTHIEALDNFAIGLVEEKKFSEAIPFLEQSAVAEPSSPLSFVYLVKCYEENGEADKSEACACFLSHHWPDKSPYIDWSHLDNPEPKQLIFSPLEEGQVWKYQNSSDNEDSRVWIKMVELDVQGNPIVHISVTNVVVPERDPMFVSHLPYDAKALMECLTERQVEKQEWSRDDDYFGEGYGMWFEAYNVGEAGVFTAPLSEVLVGMLQNVPEN